MSFLAKLVTQDLARAEAVILDSETKGLNPPTVENFRGQRLALLRVLGMLEMEKEHPVGVMKVHRSYTLTLPWPAIFAALAFLLGLAL